MGFFPLTGTEGSYQQYANAFTATVAQINADGGVHGHKLNPIVCDTGITANGAIQCGQEAVTDNAFGVVDFAQVAPFEPLLEQHNIADLNDWTDPLEYNSPISFPVFPGGSAFFVGFVATAKRVGCSTFTLVNAFPETAAAADAENASLTVAAKTLHLTVTPSVIVSSSTTDMAAPVAEALAYHPGCIGVESVGADTDGIIEAAHTADPSVKLITGEGFLAPGQFSSLPTSLATSVDIFDTSDQETSSLPAVASWLATIKKYSASPQGFNSNSVTIWSSTKILAAAASAVTTVNAASVDAYLNGDHTFDFGAMPPVNFTKPVPNPIGKRLFDACITQIRFHTNGLYYAVGPFFNVFTDQDCPS
jgi:ABC-type branched-subunit amino acid transport system substrate-binding protein